MGKIRIIGGDYPSGRASYDGNGINLKNGSNEWVDVPYSSILSIQTVAKSRRHNLSNQIKTSAGGGIIGGIAAGALAGGLTGPAGAVIGAIAGSAFAFRQRYSICRLEFSDGTHAMADATHESWQVIDRLRRAAFL